MQKELRTFAELNRLSPRETEIFLLLASRIVTFKDIAAKLGLSPSTVNNHFKSIFDKTRTNSKSELLAAFLNHLLVKHAGQQTMLKTPHAMVIDDEPEICEVISSYLTGRGMKVHSFVDPTKAFEALPGLRVDVVISDIRMPGMTGIELLQVIRQHHHYSPSILFMSGYAKDQTIEKVMDMGAIALLEKPIDLGKLYNHVMEQFIEDNFVRASYLRFSEKVPAVLDSELNLNRSCLGYGGVFMPGRPKYQIGELLSFRFKCPELPGPISATGEVVWTRGVSDGPYSIGTGVKFVQIDTSDAETIQKFVRKHRILAFIPIGRLE